MFAFGTLFAFETLFAFGTRFALRTLFALFAFFALRTGRDLPSREISAQERAVLDFRRDDEFFFSCLLPTLFLGN